MADVGWTTKLSQAVTPYLEPVRKEILSLWPGKEPELVLLYWLCQRHGLTPPTGIDFKPEDIISSTDGFGSPKKPSAADISARSALPPTNPVPPKQPRPAGDPRPGPPLAVVTGATIATTATPRPPAGAGADSREITLPRPSPPRSDTPDSAGRRSRRSIQSASPLADPPELKELMGLGVYKPAAGPKTIFDNTLSKIHTKVGGDVHRHLGGRHELSSKNDSMRAMISQFREDIRGKFLEKVPLFALNIIAPEQRSALVGMLRPSNFKKNEYIVKEGDMGDCMYIIEHGSCTALVTKADGSEVILNQLFRGAFFGEIAVINEVKRTASIRAAMDCTLLSLSRDDLFATVGESERHKLAILAKIQVFNNISLLSSLTPDQKLRVAEALKPNKYYKGMVLAGENHITTHLHIVDKGTIEMEAKGNLHVPAWFHMGSDRKKQVGRGQFFGMRGLLYGSPVGFSMTATSDEVHTSAITLEEILAVAKDDTERQSMMATMRDTMQASLLRNIPELRHLPEIYFQPVKAQATVVKFKRWSVIFSKGEPIDEIYILEQGKVIEHDGEFGSLAETTSVFDSKEYSSPGEFFGEECIEERRPLAKHTLVALTDVTLLRLAPSVVVNVLQQEEEHLASVPLLSKDVISKTEQHMLVKKLRPLNFPGGVDICKKGDSGDCLYMIESGVCDIVVPDGGTQVVVAQLKKGSYFGELAVLYDMPRTATVRTVTDVVALTLARKDLMATVSPDRLPILRECAQVQLCSNVPLLKALPKETAVKVTKRCQSDTFSKGVAIAEPGQPQSRVYVVEQGAVELSRPESSPEILDAGQFFGFTGLLNGAPHLFRAVAVSEEVRTLSFSYEDILATADNDEERSSLERLLREALSMYLLRKVPQLARKPLPFVRDILERVEEKYFKPGEVVFSKGSVLTCVYVLEMGRLGWSITVYSEAVDEDGGSATTQKMTEDKVGAVFAKELLEENPVGRKSHLEDQPRLVKQKSISGSAKFKNIGADLMQKTKSSDLRKSQTNGRKSGGQPLVRAHFTLMAETDVKLLSFPPHDALAVTPYASERP